jgi:hypothetical protein
MNANERAGSLAVAEVAKDAYGITTEIDGIHVECWFPEGTPTRWLSRLERTARAYRKLHRMSRRMLAVHLHSAGARRGQRWIARIGDRSLELDAE